MSRYGPEHRALREVVLEEEPYCLGYPIGVHGADGARSTTLDHITPLIRGGATVRANAQGLCGACNSRKSLDERRRTWRSR